MKREYIKIINDIQNLLNKKGRSKKGYDAQENFISLLQELKKDYNATLSTKYFFNLMGENPLNISKKRQKIRNLLRGIEKIRDFRLWRGLEPISYITTIKEWGYNKHNKAIIKNIRVQKVGKEFITTKRENFNFISI